MDLFLKVSAGILLSLVFVLFLSKTGKDYSLVIMVVTCCFVCAAAFSFLEPVLDFAKQLQGTSNLDNEIFTIILKAVGISLLTEIISNICTDSGNGAMGKILQMFSGIVVLWLSLPIFSALLELVKDILVEA